MKKILVIGRAFPNAAHGYINNDIDYLSERAEVLVLSPNQPMAPFYSPVDFNYFSDEKDLVRQARQFKPDFIIAWLLPNHYFARTVAEALGVPFVLKLHTPDYHTLLSKDKESKLKKMLSSVKSGPDETHLSKTYRVSKKSLQKTSESSQLRGVYCIPALREAFLGYFPENKLFELAPRIFYDRYHDESDNGSKVMLLGSLLNRREGTFAFGKILSGIEYSVDWYPMPTPGCLWLDIPDVPANVNFMKYRPPADMPTVYKDYKAIVMIGSGRFSRGLSLSILEAQAAGVAVIAPSLRPDFDDFVTRGGGFVFKDESEINGMLAGVPDASRRSIGFKNAADFDIAGVAGEFRQAGLTL